MAVTTTSKAKATATSTPQELAIALAGKQVEAGKLGWVTGTGYALQYGPILQATGLKYGPAWRAITAHYMPQAERMAVAGVPEPALGQRIADARLVHGQSWGYISMRTGLGEARCARLFALATGYVRTGLRNGHGGAFAAGRPELYTGGQCKVLGSEVPVGVKPAVAKPTTKMRKLAAAVRPVAAVPSAK